MIGSVGVMLSRIEQIEVIPHLVHVFIRWEIPLQTGKVFLAEEKVSQFILEYNASIEEPILQQEV